LLGLTGFSLVSGDSLTKDPGCLEVLFRRRTIRKFKEKPIDEEIVRRIVKAGQRAPSACNLQTCSIIWVKDPKKRKEVLRACGNPDISAPVVLVICADLRRLARTLSALGYEDRGGPKGDWIHAREHH